MARSVTILIGTMLAIILCVCTIYYISIFDKIVESCKHSIMCLPF